MVEPKITNGNNFEQPELLAQKAKVQWGLYPLV